MSDAKIVNPFHCFATLPQLQPFIWLSDFQSEDRNLKDGGYQGMPVLVKLNRESMFFFRWPFPEKRAELDMQVVERNRAVREQVIPLDIGIDVNTLHEAIVKIGLGSLLINLRDSNVRPCR